MCPWRKCGVQSIASFDKYMQHVMYHPFHTKLKAIDPFLKAKYKVKEQCTRLPPSVNAVHIGYGQFKCLWDICEVGISYQFCKIL